MQIDFSERFLKQDRELRDDILHARLQKIVHTVKDAETLRDIPNLKKLKGHRSAYRIRVGDFRVGVFIKDDTVIFADFDHRKDIYKRYP